MFFDIYKEEAMMVKLFSSWLEKARGPGFKSWSRYTNFRDLLQIHVTIRLQDCLSDVNHQNKVTQPMFIIFIKILFNLIYT